MENLFKIAQFEYVTGPVHVKLTFSYNDKRSVISFFVLDKNIAKDLFKEIDNIFKEELSTWLNSFDSTLFEKYICQSQNSYEILLYKNPYLYEILRFYEANTFLYVRG